MIEVPKNHKHHWSPYEPFGCWCGETQVGVWEKGKKVREVCEKLDRGEPGEYVDIEQDYSSGEYPLYGYDIYAKAEEGKK